MTNNIPTTKELSPKYRNSPQINKAIAEVLKIIVFSMFVIYTIALILKITISKEIN